MTVRTVFLEGRRSHRRKVDDHDVVFTSFDDATALYETSATGTVFVAVDKQSAKGFARLITSGSDGPRFPAPGRRKETFVALKPPAVDIGPALMPWFKSSIVDPDFRWLPADEMAEILSLPAKERRTLVIGGAVTPSLKSVTLVRGDFSSIAAPFSKFRPSGTSKPDFNKFRPADFGNTLAFGDYESTVDVLLYESDPAYRRQARKRERLEKPGFGASLRRLRLLKGISQADFQGVDRKTIARLEAGETGEPQRGTKDILEKTLGVPFGEITSF